MRAFCCSASSSILVSVATRGGSDRRSSGGSWYSPPRSSSRWPDLARLPCAADGLRGTILTPGPAGRPPDAGSASSVSGVKGFSSPSSPRRVVGLRVDLGFDHRRRRNEVSSASPDWADGGAAAGRRRPMIGSMRKLPARRSNRVRSTIESRAAPSVTGGAPGASARALAESRPPPARSARKALQPSASRVAAAARPRSGSARTGWSRNGRDRTGWRRSRPESRHSRYPAPVARSGRRTTAAGRATGRQTHAPATCSTGTARAGCGRSAAGRCGSCRAPAPWR